MRATIQPPSLEAFWELVQRQHGVISRAQLLALGYSPKAIRHRLKTGRLHAIWRGVYVVGRPEVSRHGRWMAAVLACGPDAFLSHSSAAALFEIRPLLEGLTEVSIPTGYDRRLAGLTAHRRLVLTPQDITERDGIPVTTPACTLVDLAVHLGSRRLEAAINEADKRDLITPEQLRASLEAMKGRQGVALVRKTLDQKTFTLTDSDLERRFLPIARRSGLPRPETQVTLCGLRVDFYWRQLALVVETDGLRYHRTPAQQATDRTRDQILTAAGFTCLRFTRAQVRYEPRRVQSVLTKVATRLQAAAESEPL